MSDSQHTPGPWELDFGRDGDFVVYHGEIGTICCGDDELIEWMANARLIAGAPVLFRELESLVRECEEMGHNCDPARKALSAAKGETT